MITKELITLKKLIKKFLIKDLYARDNDAYLQFKVWEYQNRNLDYKSLKNGLITGFLFSTESIRRARQAIQEHYPETRGIIYFKRHNMQEEIKAILKEYKNI